MAVFWPMERSGFRGITLLDLEINGFGVPFRLDKDLAVTDKSLVGECVSMLMHPGVILLLLRRGCALKTLYPSNHC